MSTSAREPGPSKDGPSKDEPLKYAPKKARHTGPSSEPAGAQPKEDGISQSRAPEAADPPWRRRHRGGAAFAGDVAVAELRTKLALAPDRLPEPPPPSSSRSTWVWAARLTGLAVVVAVGFVGYRWGSSPASLVQPPQFSTQPVATAVEDSAGGTTMNAAVAVYTPSEKTSAPPSNGRPLRQLMVQPVAAQQTDGAARLAISAVDAGPHAAVVISGLIPGSVLSAGKEVSPNTWRLSVEELAGASVTPPRGFVGVIDLTLELRLADNTVVDRKGLQLEWVAKRVAATPRQHDAAEIAQMVKRGAELVATGDIAAARLMYQRAAETGEAAAAFALAETYDPLALAKGKIAPDVGLAQMWYEKARDLGSTLALERLERLARLPG
jgi:hypothetical protein